MMTKIEALHEFEVYMHDLRAEASREGYDVDRAQTWDMMVESWVAEGKISEETGKQWIASGPNPG